MTKMDKPMIPEGAQAGKSVRSNYIGGYADVVQVYLERGWVSVLPLPPGQKSPPPTGFTGRGAQIPTPEQVETGGVRGRMQTLLLRSWCVTTGSMT